MSDKNQAEAIRDLNDKFRRSLTGGTLLLTAGIVALGAEAQARIIAAVQAFDAFTPDNDPYGEHDFGSVEVDGENVFFKFDYFDLNRAMHSDDPADPSKTERVMTIMLSSWKYALDIDARLMYYYLTNEVMRCQLIPAIRCFTTKMPPARISRRSAGPTITRFAHTAKARTSTVLWANPTAPV